MSRTKRLGRLAGWLLYPLVAPFVQGIRMAGDVRDVVRVIRADASDREATQPPAADVRQARSQSCRRGRTMGALALGVMALWGGSVVWGHVRPFGFQGLQTLSLGLMAGIRALLACYRNWLLRVGEVRPVTSFLRDPRNIWPR